MPYSYTFASRDEARQAGHLCCCVCLLDLGSSDDPYRDPSCPRCLDREMQADSKEDLDGEELADKTGYDLHPEGDDRDDSPIEMDEATLERWDFDSNPDWR